MTRTSKILLAGGLGIAAVISMVVLAMVDFPELSFGGRTGPDRWEIIDPEYQARADAAEARNAELGKALKAVVDTIPSGHEFTQDPTQVMTSACLMTEEWPQQVDYAARYILKGAADARPAMHEASDRLVARGWHLTKLADTSEEQEWVLRKNGNTIPIQAGVSDGILNIVASGPCVHLDGTVDGGPAD